MQWHMRELFPHITHTHLGKGRGPLIPKSTAAPREGNDAVKLRGSGTVH